MKEIVIIGGGFSGTLVAYHLVNQSSIPLKVFLIEKSNSFAEGLAYRTTDPLHLLNVPAGNMSAFESGGPSFLDWQRQRGIKVDPSDYCPRKTYGEYLKNLLSLTLKNSSLELVSDEAIEVSQNNNGKLKVFTQKGKTFFSDRIILALGHFPPGHFAGQHKEVPQSPRYITQFWSSPRWLEIPKNASIGIIGSGLSMVDASVGLWGREHQGPIYALSRRGLHPNVHGEKDQNYNLKIPNERDPLSLLKFVRKEIKSTNWRNVIDGFRPFTNSIWMEWDLAQKRKFLRYIRPFWEVHRHRIAPSIYSLIQSQIKSGQLTFFSSKIQAIQTSVNGFNIDFLEKKSHQKKSIQVEYLIDCSGPESDYRRINHPLIQSLIDNSFAIYDPLKMGLSSNDLGQLINPNFYAIGPIRKGQLLETTAVPELRRQAEVIANLILESLNSEKNNTSNKLESMTFN